MKKLLNPFWAGLLLCVVGVILVAATGGCATKPGGGVQNPLTDCARWQKVVAIYDELIASGAWQPSEDERRSEVTARALLAVACGNAKLVDPSGAAKALTKPRQPDLVYVDGVTYRLHTPWKIIQDPTGVFAKSVDYGPWVTVTIGPLYSCDSDYPGSGCLYCLPLAYERGLTDEVGRMYLLGCGQ